MNILGDKINNRFLIERMIGDGRYTSRYRAVDLWNNRAPVLLDLFKNSAISAKIQDIIRFKMELYAVSRLGHESIVRIIDIGEFVEILYVASEYFEGASCEELLAQEAVTIERSVDIVARVAGALAYLHDNKIIHKDVSPANIYLSGPRVILSGIGISHIRRFDETPAAGELLELFRYTAPEQFGIMQRTIDERSDLYSLGAVFYRLLTGRDAFQGKDVNAVIHGQMAQVPERPGSINRDVPVMLERIVMKLLEKEPENRYQSARGLLADLDKYAAGGGEFLPGLADRATRLVFRTRLVGREKEMNALIDLFGGARGGNGGVCIISGEAGSGKTRLVDELKGHIYGIDGHIIDGRCSVHNYKIPYEPFRQALGAWMSLVNRFSDDERKRIADELSQEFRNFGKIVVKLNPEMERLLGDCTPLVSLDPEQETKRFRTVLSSFFLKLSDLSRRLVVVLDDLHWADEGTITILHEIMENIADHPLAVICLFRDDEISPDHGIMKLIRLVSGGDIPGAIIHLDRLDAESTGRLISGLLLEPANRTAAISEYVYKIGKGNPFFTAEILKQLIDEKVLAYRRGRWSLDSALIPRAGISDTIVDIILKRMRHLNDIEWQVLSLASVIGMRFDMKLLIRISWLDETDVVRVVDRAVDLQILVEQPGRDDIVFSHDRIRDALYDAISVERRRRLHLDIAKAIEESGADRDDLLFEITNHYIEGGDVERARVYSYPAGVRAMKDYANEDALGYFMLALGMKGQDGAIDSGQSINIWRHIARVRMNMGDYDRAADIYRKLLPLIMDVNEKADACAMICSAHFKKGEWKKCEDTARLAMGLYGMRLPDRKPVLVLSIIKELIVHGFHSLFPGLYYRVRENVDPRWLAMGKIAMSLTWSYVYSDTLKFLRLAVRSLNVAERRMGKSREAGMALAGYGAILMAIPLFGRAIRVHERALSFRKEIKDEWGVAQSLQWMGFCFLWKGEYKKSLGFFNESASMFRQIGDMREYGFSIFGAFQCYYYLSDYQLARIFTEEYINIPISASDNYNLSVYWAWFSIYYMETGDYDSAELCGLTSYYLSRDAEIWYVNCVVASVLGALYLEKGSVGQALSYLYHAKELNENNNFMQYYVVRLYPAIAEARIAEYRAGEITDAAWKKKALRDVRAACRESMRKTKKWVSHHGASLLASAKYRAMVGDTDGAGRLFARSIELNAKLGNRYNLARCHYEYGLFLSQTDDVKKTRQNLEAAYQIFNEIGSRQYVERMRRILGIAGDESETTPIERLVDGERMTSVARLAREINRMTDAGDLMITVLSRAVEIAGARRGCIYIAGEDGRLHARAIVPAAGIVFGDYSMGIIERVYAEGDSVVVKDALKDPEYPGGGARTHEEPRSVLCLPVVELEKTIGVCYLDNSLAPGVFGAKEADLVRLFLSSVSYARALEIIQHASEEDREIDARLLTSSIPPEKMEMAMDYINKNFMSEISREGLAAHVGMHHDNLGRYFKIYYGKKINDYINGLRIQEAIRRLTETDERIVDIAFSVGFGSVSNFNKAFRQVMKVSPDFFRKKNR
ncbi:MAG: AAA family ATPase [Spirochaetes bacterium]|nr:AAA family ATPase [Spirochaetota bacterium]